MIWMRMYRLFGRIWKRIRISKSIERIKIKREQKRSVVTDEIIVTTLLEFSL